MTPAQAKGPVPMTNILRDIRTQLAAILVILNGAGAIWQSPAEAQVERRLAAVEARVDSLVQGLRAVKLLIAAECITTDNPMVLATLECRK